jgi:transcriptional regulator with XRE-family HTH domain
MMNSFAKYIKKFRSDKGLSQEDISSRMNITLSAYSKIERGLTDPSLSRMRQIADILKFDLADMLYAEKEASMNQFQENMDFDSYRFVSKKEFYELKNLVLDLQKKIEAK